MNLGKKLISESNLAGIDPGMFSMAENPMIEKSAGHPLLDRIHTAFQELEATKATAAQYTQMREALTGEVTAVKMNLVLVISGGEMTKEQMLQAALKGNPDLASEMERSQQLREHVNREMDELLAGGQNRQDRAFQLEVPIAPEHARSIVSGLAGDIPGVRPQLLADTLNEAAIQVMDPE